MYFSTVDSLLISRKSALPTSATVQQQSASFVSTSKEHFWEWDYSHAFGLYFLCFGVEFEVSLLPIREAYLLLTAKLLPNYSNYCWWWNGGEMRGLVIWPVILNHHKRRDSCAVPWCAFNAGTASIMIKSFGFCSFIVFSSFPVFFTTCGAEIKMLFGR